MPVTKSGETYGLPLSPGVTTASMLTSGGYSNIATQANGINPDVVQSTSNQAITAGNKPVVWFLAILAFLVIAEYARKHEKMKLDNPKIIGIGVLNWIFVTALATSGIFAFKVILNKWHVKGLTDLINVV